MRGSIAFTLGGILVAGAAAAAPSATLVTEFDDYSDGLVAAGESVYVTNVYADAISVINAKDAKVTTTVKVGRGPIQIATDGSTLYVVNQFAQDDGDAYVSVVDADTNTVTHSLGVSVKPQGSDPNNYPMTGFPTDAALVGEQLFVTYPTNATPDIMPVDVDTWTEHTLFNAGSGPWHLGGVGDKLIVTNERAMGGFSGAVLEYATDGTLLKTFETGGQPRYVANAGGKAYVTLGQADGSGKLAVIDPTAMTFKTVAIGKNPWGMAVAGDKLYVACNGSQRLDVIDVATDAVVGSVDLSGLTGAPRAVAFAAGRFFVKTVVPNASPKLPHARIYAVSEE